MRITENYIEITRQELLTLDLNLIPEVKQGELFEIRIIGE
jgi:hypothetical protein